MPWLRFALVALSFGWVSMAAAQQGGPALLQAHCAGCHEAGSGGLSRISAQRKTPEGWDMTIARMMLLHGVEMNADERRTLVKHLADTRGLAPAETAGWRYILERTPGVIEEPPDGDLAVLCARCHSYARIALQRRSEADWLKHAHFHLGQYPTTEYQALGRDRNWWELASTEAPKRLAELYPLESEAWQSWQGREAAELSGNWRIVGERPDLGRFHGTAQLKATGGDGYSTALELHYQDGRSFKGDGRAILYTGFELRASVQLGLEATRQVLALSEDGTRLSGRWFLADQDAIGGPLTLVREGSDAVLAVEPPYLKAGESVALAIHGVGLAGDVSLGEGVTVEAVEARDARTVWLRAQVAADAAPGTRTVTVGEASGEGLLAVYREIDRVAVEPAYTIARVGGGGGPIPRVPAQFAAVGWLNGPDGAAETGDDVRLGTLPASWAVENFDETAASLDDAHHTGAIQQNGIFIPAEAGLNPERPFQTNNAGNLSVIATVLDGARKLEGSAQLIVTVQRWIDSPIR